MIYISPSECPPRYAPKMLSPFHFLNENHFNVVNNGVVSVALFARNLMSKTNVWLGFCSQMDEGEA
jgi:hypothetical protein